MTACALLILYALAFLCGAFIELVWSRARRA